MLCDIYFIVKVCRFLIVFDLIYFLKVIKILAKIKRRKAYYKGEYNFGKPKEMDKWVVSISLDF